PQMVGTPPEPPVRPLGKKKPVPGQQDLLAPDSDKLHAVDRLSLPGFQPFADPDGRLPAGSAQRASQTPLSSLCTSHRRGVPGRVAIDNVVQDGNFQRETPADLAMVHAKRTNGFQSSPATPPSATLMACRRRR